MKKDKAPKAPKIKLTSRIGLRLEDSTLDRIKTISAGKKESDALRDIIEAGINVLSRRRKAA